VKLKTILVFLGFMVIIWIFLIGFILYDFGEDVEKRGKNIE
jgi:hypothetical protein